MDRLPQAERYISIRSEVFAAVETHLAALEDGVDKMPLTDPKKQPAFASFPGAGTHVALKNLVFRFDLFMGRLEIAEALEEVVNCLRLVRLGWSWFVKCLDPVSVQSGIYNRRSLEHGNPHSNGVSPSILYQRDIAYMWHIVAAFHTGQGQGTFRRA